MRPKEAAMEPLVPKCFLLPIDGTEESLKPVSFLKSLYPNREHLGLILSYFVPPLPPIYRERPDSEAMAKKKLEIVHSRQEDARAILSAAQKVLIEAGFSEDTIQEHVEAKELSSAHHACRLADIRKVDAVIVQKRIGSGLEGLLRGDPAPALLHHCLVSPVWMNEGEADTSRAAICLQNENASLRAADHAAFMLAETRAHVTVLHASRSVASPITSRGLEPNDQIGKWLATPEGRELRPFLTEACSILMKEGIECERAQIALIPAGRHASTNILAYCRDQAIGIVVLGHSSPGGTWGFLKSSITKKILAEFKNMAVWVAQ